MVKNNPLKVTNVLGCSYHPKSCTCDPTMINFEAEHFKLEYGTAGLTFPCYQSSLNPRHVTRSKSIRTSDMVHAILWPSIGNFAYHMGHNKTNFMDFCHHGNFWHLLKVRQALFFLLLAVAVFGGFITIICNRCTFIKN